MMYPNQQPAPMQRQANQMARQGRYGDSMLVHMNPAEVQGIAALSPTGQLTRNPMTGQPEAFLPFLAPLIGSMAGKAFLGKTVGSALAGAIGSGLATTAVTGDIKKGLMSGITGFGLGKALGAASDALNPEISGTASALGEAQKTAAEASADLAKAGIAGGSQPFTPAQIGEFTAAKTAADAATQNVTDLTQNLANLRGEQTIADSLTAPFRQPGAFGKALMDPLTLTAIGTGEGQRAQMEAEESIMDQNRRFERERQAELDRAYATRDAAIGLAQSRYMAGGITGINPQNYQSALQGFDNLVNGTNNYFRGGQARKNKEEESASDPVAAAASNALASAAINYGSPSMRFGPGGIPSGASMVPGGAAAAARQAALRGGVKSAAELAQEYGADFRPGFGGEINYFKDARPKTEVPEGVAVNNPVIGSGGVDAAPFAGFPSTMPSFNITNPTFNIGMEGFGGVEPEALRAMAAPQSTASPDVGAPNVMRDPVAMGIPAPPPSPITPPMSDMKESVLDNFISERRKPPISASRPKAPMITKRNTEEMVGIPLSPIRPNPIRMPSLLEIQEPMIPIGVGAIGREESSNIPPPPPPVVRPPMPPPPPPPVAASPVDAPSVSRPPVVNLPPPPPPVVRPPMPPPRPRPISPPTLDEIDSELGRLDTRRRPRRPPGFQEGGATDMPDRSMNPTMESNGQMIIERAVQAISGRLSEDEAEAAINRFIDEFGSETFAMLRDRVLKDIVPGAQTEGEITGIGGGMDDMIPGMIGEQQPVAVSPGEYIVPADVVSGIGDGSTDAGVDELNGMLDRVRMERTGTTIQPSPMRSGGILPA